MKELYDAMKALEIVREKQQEIIHMDGVLLDVIDSLSVKISENERDYNALKNEAEELRKNIKIFELIYFCQTGKHPDECK